MQAHREGLWLETQGALEAPARLVQPPLMSSGAHFGVCALVAAPVLQHPGASQDTGPGRVVSRLCPSFPGCEFFKEYKDRDYMAEGLIFNWKQV